MLVLAALVVVLLALSALAALCDRWGPADPAYPLTGPLELVPLRCSGPLPGPVSTRRHRSDVA
jgi:hypothetical protein